MKKDFNLLFVCLFVSALFANTNAVAGNWNSSGKGTIAKVEGTINLFVPDDVMKLLTAHRVRKKSNIAVQKVIMLIKKLKGFL